MKITYGVSAALLMFALATGASAPAYAQSATTTPSLAARIAALLAEIEALQAQIAELQAKQQVLREEVHETVRLTRTLVRGATGDDVEELQELLASDSEIYPEGLVTGFFGPLTERAVVRFQERFGIEQVGIVGPLTRGTLNRVFSQLNRGPGSLNRGPGNIFDRLEVEIGDDEVEITIDLSELKRGERGIRICHVPPGNRGAARTIAVGGPAVQAHLAHGDTLGSCDDDEEEKENGNDESGDEDEDEKGGEEEQQDETAPLISNMNVSVASSTAAIVTWNTDEASDSTVWFSTTQGFSTTDSVEKEGESDLVTSHSIDLSTLVASTTYYIIVGSEDAAGNAATSSESSFVTP